jgi:hypothetical protein
MKIKDVPLLAGKMLEKQMKIRKGDVYTMESVNEITITPDKAEQKVISTRSSFPEMFDVDMQEFYNYNIYRIYEGSFISPVTRQGLSVYHYRLEYSYRDNDLLIHHIKIIPRNKNPYAFSGYIDIIDGSWHVYNFDFTGSLDLGIAKMQFTIKQNYVPVENNVWMAGSFHETCDVKMMGYNLMMTLASAIQYKDYTVNPALYASNPAVEPPMPAPKKKPVISKKSEQLTQKITSIMEKEDLTTHDAIKLVELIEEKNKEDLKNNPKNDSINPLEIQKRYFITTDSNASHYDSALWADYRTIPLSEEEVNGFEQKRINDSIQKEEKTEKGSIKKDLKVVKKKNFHAGIHLFNSTLAFNTVEGFKAGINAYANKRFKDSATTLNNSINFGYAFASKHFFLTASSQWKYNLKRFASLEVFGGKQTCDFQQKQDGAYFVNSISSLFFRNNLIQYYDRTFAGVKHKIEACNGYQTTVEFSYEQQQLLDNRTDYSFFFRKRRQYKSNIPDNECVTNNSVYISDQTAFLAKVSVSYTPYMFYRYSENKKVKSYAGSKFPTFTLSWTKGINGILGSNSRFDYLEVNITQKLDLKEFKTFQYSVSAGVFPDAQRIHFSQFRHFQTNDFWIAFNNFYGNFNTMPNYRYSTCEWFASGHAKYETLYLFLKYIPKFNKTLITENLHLSFLSNPLTKAYVEVGYSLSKIYFIGNIGFFLGFDEFKTVNWSVRAGISLF